MSSLGGPTLKKIIIGDDWLSFSYPKIMIASSDSILMVGDVSKSDRVTHILTRSELFGTWNILGKTKQD